MFATHYHPVSRGAVKSENIAPFHMAARLDEVTQEMTFLYRFLPGLCPASHGHNVARLAGLPDAVLQDARVKSAEFELGTNEGRKAVEAMTADILRLSEASDSDGLRALFRRRHQ